MTKQTIKKTQVQTKKTNSKVIPAGVSSSKKPLHTNRPVKLKGKKVSNIARVENPIIEIQGLTLSYKQDSSYELKKVIRNVDLTIKKGETFALIGESGSGKSVLTSTIYGLQGQNAVFESGKVIIKGQEVQGFSPEKWERSGLRGTTVSAVFQNPMTSLNPTMKIGKQIVEGIILNKRADNVKVARAMALEILTKMRIQDPKMVMNAYPHQLSGGMRQRAIIAIIVSCKPEIIVMDEPTTALDPSVQAEVLQIIENLKNEFGLTIVFITHDLGVVSSIADRIGIMYAGEIIEIGTKEEIVWNPGHPYTWGLLQSMPDLNKGNRLSTIKGSVPTNLSKIVGDAFSPRNDFAMGIDFNKSPDFYQISETHFVKSWLYDEKAPKIVIPSVIKERMEQWKAGK